MSDIEADEDMDLLSSPRAPSRRHFEVLVVGNLRNEKDPLRAALAASENSINSRSSGLAIIFSRRSVEKRLLFLVHDLGSLQCLQKIDDHGFFFPWCRAGDSTDSL